MSITCKNCKHTFIGNYCNYCGQAAATHKINLHFLWHDIQHGLLHIDKGILFTLKELFTRPGHSIREFIEGKRVRHFKPISMVIVLATIYGIFYHYFHIGSHPESQSNIQESADKINEWASKHMSFVHVLFIPLFSIASYLAFYKQGYNFIEHLVLNSFLAGQRLFYILFTFPLLDYFNHRLGKNSFLKLQLVIDMCLLTWGYIQFFNKLNKVKSFLFSILSITIALFLILMIFILIFNLVDESVT